VSHICVRSLQLHAACRVIVAVWHLTNHNHESCIWHLWDGTFRFFACALSQIRRRLVVALPSLLPLLPNLACTFPQNHLNLLSPNPFGIIEVFPGQPLLESLQKIFIRRLPVQGSISLLIQTVLSWDNGPMLLLEKPSHHTLLHLLNAPMLGCPILLANCFKENSICFKLIWALPSAPPKSNKSSLS